MKASLRLFLFFLFILLGLGGRVLSNDQLILEIADLHRLIQGRSYKIPVYKISGDVEISGFNLAIAFDSRIAESVRIIPGDSIADNFVCGWDRFDYKIEDNVPFQNNLVNSLVRIVCNYNSGRLIDIPDSTILFQIEIFVTNNRNYECAFMPLRFCWGNYNDNLVWLDGNQCGIVMKYCDIKFRRFKKPLNPIFPNKADYYPSTTGITIENLPSSSVQYAKPLLILYSGFVDILCSGLDARGDISIGGGIDSLDLVLYKDFFLYGLRAFKIAIEAQIAASEVKEDGYPLTVEDFVFDIILYNSYYARYEPPNGVFDTEFITSNKKDCLNLKVQSDADLPAVWFVFNLDTTATAIDNIVLDSSIDYMAYEYAISGDSLKLFIYPPDLTKLDKYIKSGFSDLLTIEYDGKPPELIKVETSDTKANRARIRIRNK